MRQSDLKLSCSYRQDTPFFFSKKKERRGHELKLNTDAPHLKSYGLSVIGECVQSTLKQALLASLSKILTIDMKE